MNRSTRRQTRRQTRHQIRRTLLLPASLALLAGGCAIGEDYQRPTPPMPDAWRGVDAPAGQGVTSDAADLSDWWMAFDDPAMVDLVKVALVNSPDLREAAGRVLEARYRRAATAGERLPQVEADASYTRSRQSETIGDDGFAALGAGSTGGSAGGFAGGGFDPESDLFQAGLSANWELDLFGRIGRRVEAADARVQSELADFYAVRVSLAAEVGLAYVDVRSLQNRLSIARQNADLQRRSLDLARARFDNGLSSELDVAEALSNLQQTLAEIPTLTSDLQAAKNRLSLLTGRLPGAVDAELESETDAGVVPVPPTTVAVGVPTDLLRRRPDIRSAERDVAEAVASVSAARADQYPRFSLGGTFGFASDDLDQLFDWDSRTFGIGPSVSWPIFQGGTLRALVKAEDAVTLQRVAAYERSVLSAMQETSDALTAYGQSRQRQAVLGEAVAAARRAVEISDAQYRQGIIEFDRVLDAQRTQFLAEDAKALADANVSINLIGLYRALGGGWDAPIDDTDSPGTRPTTSPASRPRP